MSHAAASPSPEDFARGWADGRAQVVFRRLIDDLETPVSACLKLGRGEPIGWRQGFGVIFDDLVAALCALLVIALWRLV